MASSSEQELEVSADDTIIVKKDLDQYISNKIEEYLASSDDDEVLWSGYQEDFEKWTEVYFKTVKRNLASKLRQVLRLRGVWVQTNSKKATMAKALMDTAQEEERSEWSDFEIVQFFDSGSEGQEITSHLLNFRLKKYKEQGTATSADTRPTPIIPLTPAIRSEPLLQQQQTQPLLPSAQVSTPSQPQVPPRTQLPTSYQFKHNVTPELNTEPHTEQQNSTQQILTAPSGFGRELANMTKMYTPEMKYGSEGDNFGLKLVVFNDFCSRVNLPQEGWHKAFPIMLKGLAWDYYYTDLIQLNYTFSQLCNTIQGHFEDANYKRGTLAEWNKLDLLLIKSQNPDKSTTHCFQLLLSKLRTLRHGLTPDLQSEDFMLNKIVLACRDLPDCQIACSAPANTLSGLISSVKNSISAYEHAHKNQAATADAFMTDRRYYDNGSGSRGNRRGNGHSYRSSQGRSGNSYSQGCSNSSFKGKKRCFVWSSNHTEAEQQQSKERFKAKYGGRFGNRYSKPFEKSFRQYITDYEGTEDDAINKAFHSIGIEGSDSEDNETFDDTEDSESFMTSLGQILTADAEQFILILNNKAFFHSISHLYLSSLAKEIKTKVLTSSELKHYGL
jgi:hypothetical protein